MKNFQGFASQIFGHNRSLVSIQLPYRRKITSSYLENFSRIWIFQTPLSFSSFAPFSSRTGKHEDKVRKQGAQQTHGRKEKQEKKNVKSSLKEAIKKNSNKPKPSTITKPIQLQNKKQSNFAKSSLSKELEKGSPKEDFEDEFQEDFEDEFEEESKYIKQEQQKEGSPIYRLNKILARGQFGSRRGVEDLISKGKVTVNGKKVLQNIQVSLDDSILVDGKPVEIPPTKVFLHNKKRGVLVTHAKDRDGKLILFEQLKRMGIQERLISVGRLDYNTEGLLILTNSGALARHLELPRNKFERKYIVEVFGKITHKKIKALNKGIFINGISYEGKAEDTGNSWLQITLWDGKNRHIRRALKVLHLEVKRLIRIKYGPYTLEGLNSGDVKEVPLKPELKEFRNKL